VGERFNRSGKRLLLRVDDAAVCSIPPQWTDADDPDPEVMIGQGRAREGVPLAAASHQDKI
jgi:hypothetical protein